MKRRRTAAAVGAACLLTLNLDFGTAAAAAGINRPSNSVDVYRALKLFGDAFSLVRADYVDNVSDKMLVQGAINGMLTALDPHSNYLDATDLDDMSMESHGEFAGVGIEVSMENRLIKVISPIDDTPAAHAGIKPGDLITHIDGTAVQGMTPSQAVDKIRGPVNSDITLMIQRSGRSPFDIKLTRAMITISAVRSKLEGGNIGYIRISSFTDQTDVGLNKAMKALKKESSDKLAGIVLDLRNDPGGLLDQAVAVASAFIDKGEIVSTRGRRPDDAERYNSHTADITRGLPMAVLINGGSASASEIVAGALQDHHRAIVIGTRSFGKGSVQTIIPLEDGAMLLTTARYYTPSGRSIQALGIKPDIVVEAARIEHTPQDSKSADAETAAPAAGNDPTSSKNDDAAEQDTVDQSIIGTADDYQLVRAIEMLRGIAIFNGPMVNWRTRPAP
jgi:carboxyl-terminal processing protease